MVGGPVTPETMISRGNLVICNKTQRRKQNSVHPSTLTQSTSSYNFVRIKQADCQKRFSCPFSYSEITLLQVCDFILLYPVERLASTLLFLCHHVRGVSPSHAPVPDARDNVKSVKQHPPLPQIPISLALILLNLNYSILPFILHKN